MSDLLILSEDVKRWFEQTNIKVKASKHFLDYLEEYRRVENKEFEETFPDFHEEKLTVNVQKIEVFLDWINYPFHYIIICISIVYKDISIGMYKVMFDISGEIIDSSWAYY